MYALHPGSLPPKGALDKQRIEVSAKDLVRLYKLGPHDYIIWDPEDGYDPQDFIHLYPSFYSRYTLVNGLPQSDLPNGKVPALRRR